jgi:hypothetical protein
VIPFERESGSIPANLRADTLLFIWHKLWLCSEVPDICSDICSDVYSHIFSDICSGQLFWYLFWYMLQLFVLTWSDIFYLANFMWHIFGHLFWYLPWYLFWYLVGDFEHFWTGKSCATYSPTNNLSHVMCYVTLCDCHVEFCATICDIYGVTRAYICSHILELLIEVQEWLTEHLETLTWQVPSKTHIDN